MDAKKDDLSRTDPQQLLNRPGVQALFNQLRQLDPDLLRQAAELAARGETDRARALLTPSLSPLPRETEGADGRS